MSLYRLCKGLVLTTAGSVLIATSAIALSDLHSKTVLPHCAAQAPAAMVDPFL